MKIKKSIIIAILVVSVIGLAFVGSASAISGSGTSSDPYILSSTSDLALLSGSGYASYSGANKYFELGADINFNSGSFTPIGTSSYPFIGHFDGKNHVISNMSITSSSGFSGFFSYCSGACQISNIVFRDCSVTNSGGNNSGILLGRLQGGSGANISNIETDRCNVVSSNNNAGGIAGNAAYSCNGSVTYDSCYVHDGKVTSSGDSVGGIAGNGAHSNSGTVTYSNCTVEREVVLSSNSSYTQTGGIAGLISSNDGSVTYTGCKVLSCVIKGSSYFAGGITSAIKSQNNVNFTNCVVDNTYIMSANRMYVGGITGCVEYTSNVTTKVTISGCSVTNCTIYGSSAVGGMVGRAYGTVTITNPTISHNNIRGSSYVGGAIGQNS